EWARGATRVQTRGGRGGAAAGRGRRPLEGSPRRRLVSRRGADGLRLFCLQALPLGLTISSTTATGRARETADPGAVAEGRCREREHTPPTFASQMRRSKKVVARRQAGRYDQPHFLV